METKMSLSLPTMCAIRFGYGIRPGEAPPQNAAALLAQLPAAARQTPFFPHDGEAERLALIGRMLAVRKQFTAARRKRDVEKARNLRKPFIRKIRQVLSMDIHGRFQQAVFSPYGFHERLATFWTDHFSVSTAKGPMIRLMAPLFEARAIRPHLAGPFNILLKNAVLDPAMLTYLDQTKSIGPKSPAGQRNDRGLNENLGRELLELHTVGVDGGYTQEDVRAASHMLTGMSVNQRTGEAEFRRRIAEPGLHTVMGMAFGGERRTGQDVIVMLDALAALPQTARHICRKLVVHFIADEPPEPLVNAMVTAWKASSGDLSTVYRAMLEHPLAWENPGMKARQPFDFIVAGLRAVNAGQSDLNPPKSGQADSPDTMMDGDNMVAEEPEKTMPGMAATASTAAAKKPGAGRDNPLTVQAAVDMGQPFWQPASPAGWEEGFDVWVSSSQITERISWAHRVADRFGNELDPRALIKTVLADAARDDTIKVVNQAPSRSAGLVFILASPEFNRR